MTSLEAIWCLPNTVKQQLFLLCSDFVISLPLQSSFQEAWWLLVIDAFYRAMHFSAKHGLAIACRPSVRPSVRLVDCDHIGWNSSEIISLLVSLGCSLSADPNIRILLRGTPGNIGSKWPTPCWFERWTHLIANCGRMVTDHNGEPIGNHHRSFEWCHHWPPTTSPSPKMGVPYAPKICREWPYLRNGWSDTLHVWF